jgi:hypothetical protein
VNSWPTDLGGDEEELAAITGGDPVGAAAAGPTPVYPATGAAFTTATGLTAAWLALCDEASGVVDDKIGTGDLTAGGTPVYQYAMTGGRPGLHYNSSGDKHAADINALGSASGIYSTVFQVPTNPGSSTSGIIGRSNAALTEACSVGIATANNFPSVLVRDTGAGSLSVNFGAGVNVRTGGPYIISLQIDRAAGTMRCRLSGNGALVEQITGSIAGFLSLDGASMEFGFGAVLGRVFGCANSYGFVCTGVQCEGASVLADLHAALGWE